MLRLSEGGVTSLPCYPRQTVASAGTSMRAIHSLENHLHKGAQLDIEDDGSGTPDPHESYYVLFPNHARVVARVVSVTEEEGTIQVGLWLWKIRRARPDDRVRDSGLTLRTSWFIAAPL